MSLSNARRDRLYALVDNMAATHSDWQENGNDDEREPPTPDFWGAVGYLLDTIETFSADEIPEDCEDLVDAIDWLGREMSIHATIDGWENEPPADDQFWAAYEAVVGSRNGTLHPDRNAAVELPPLPELESMAMLHGQGVPHEQIARIYGLVDSGGNGKYWLVAKELENPGSVIGPDWIDPRVAEREAEAKRLAEANEREIRAVKASRKARVKEEAPKPCPETPEELWRQGVSVAQSAKMLLMGEAEVLAMFADFEQQRHDLLAGMTPRVATQADGTVKRGRGRPRKDAAPAADIEHDESGSQELAQESAAA